MAIVADYIIAQQKKGVDKVRDHYKTVTSCSLLYCTSYALLTFETHQIVNDPYVSLNRTS